MIKAAIVGATGYTGAELVRLLRRHPQVQISHLSSQSYAGKQYSEAYPQFSGIHMQECCEQDIPLVVGEADVVFLALPHGLSVPWAVAALEKGKKVVDLGADFRIKDVQTYEEWYKVNHGAAELLTSAVYGLPEVRRDAIKKAMLVANPGCYPTASVLSLLPVLGKGIIDENRIIIDAKSGVSGAGRGLNLGVHFSEANENVKAYNVAKHRHTPEIEQEVSALAGRPVNLSFTPHLMPMTRGILATVYADLLPGIEMNSEEIRNLYLDRYSNEPFVKVLPDGVWPQTKWCYGSNYSFVGLVVDSRTRRLIVSTAIDNLIKGASGQAVQNMNLICGFEETTALEEAGIWP